MAMIRLDSLR